MPKVGETQPKNSRRVVDETRRFDKTCLRAGHHGETVHRDYAAHFFRWGFTERFIRHQETRLLDVGCGVECPLVKVLRFHSAPRPRAYLGVDMNKEPQSTPGNSWCQFTWEFDFTSRWSELGRHDLVVSFEVLEHMGHRDGLKFLRGLRGCLAKDGTLLLSTPVFDGKAAANHLHEWTVREVRNGLESAGLRVLRRHGTFASWNSIKKVMTPEERELVDGLAQYYSWEVLSCFLAPLYPDASRNNVWVCKPE